MHCMLADREVLIMYMNRSRVSSSVKSQAVLKTFCVPAGQCVLEGRKESIGALSSFCSFSTLMPFDLEIFASEWVGLMVSR